MTKPLSPLGVLLVNLGTPDEPTAPALRRYLAEFLADKRVVNLPRALWLPILYGFILPFRPSGLIPKYKYIWGERGAPIRACTQTLAEGVQAELDNMRLEREVHVVPAMTYGNPSIADAMATLRDRGITDLIIVPLFPQYSSATTAAVFDKLAAAIRRLPLIGDIRFIDEYYQSPGYIHALARSLEGYKNQLDNGTRLLFSFHGIPVAQEQAGDPYPSRCRDTAELVARQLGLGEDQWLTTFQSRFGPAPWVQPYTDETLAALPAAGTRHVVVVCPGFATDCLETLHEIDVEGRETFTEAGGESLTYVPALNDSPQHIRLVSDLVRSRLYADETSD